MALFVTLHARNVSGMRCFGRVSSMRRFAMIIKTGGAALGSCWFPPEREEGKKASSGLHLSLL